MKAGRSFAWTTSTKSLNQINDRRTATGHGAEMEYQEILVTYDPPVGILQINRPKALNDLNAPLMKEMAHAAQTMDADPAIRCIVITGNERVFAAGADIQKWSMPAQWSYYIATRWGSGTNSTIYPPKSRRRHESISGKAKA